jgi:uncharacterized damage-inducible protein DinB
MSISQALLPEFEQEMKITRSVVERLPDDKLTWKPHEKSMTFGALAAHLIDIPSWVAPTIHGASFDVAPPDGPPVSTPEIQSREHALAMFDKSVAEAAAAIAGADDETLMTNWSLLAGGKPLFTLPRISVLRGFVVSHAVHHRAQLSVYLRLNDIPVPSIYGPSADEGQM